MTARHQPGAAGRVRVAVVYGGRSSEHAISCVSAGSILRNLDPERFEVVAVGITPAGPGCSPTADPETLAITDGRLPEVSGASGTELALPADPGRGGQLLSLGQRRAGEVLAAVDVVFPVLHGPYGEDGTIQGLLELPACPMSARACWPARRAWTRSSPRSCSPPTACRSATTWCCVRTQDDAVELEDRERLGLPVFVKPARGGSSIGVSRVTAGTSCPPRSTMPAGTTPR